MAQSFFEAKIAVLFMMIMSTNSNMETDSDSDSHLLNSVLIAHCFIVICIPYARAFCV